MHMCVQPDKRKIYKRSTREILIFSREEDPRFEKVPNITHILMSILLDEDSKRLNSVRTYLRFSIGYLVIYTTIATQYWCLENVCFVSFPVVSVCQCYCIDSINEKYDLFSFLVFIKNRGTDVAGWILRGRMRNDFTHAHVVRWFNVPSRVIFFRLSKLGIGSVSTLQNSVEFTPF